MNDNFPIIKPEDDGFSIYINDEKVDWYENEADAEGVALCMVDDSLNDESFFDSPALEESSKRVREFRDTSSEDDNPYGFYIDNETIYDKFGNFWTMCDYFTAPPNMIVEPYKDFDDAEKDMRYHISDSLYEDEIGGDFDDYCYEFTKFAQEHVPYYIVSGLSESKLKEGPGSIPNYNKVYTGLAYDGGNYDNIISSFVGQIWDGIGEGSGRESKIFNYYYRDFDNVTSHEEDGELVVDVSPYAVEQLVRGIWRVAQIERSDNGWTDNNHFYDYLDADWKDICKLNAALKAAVANGNQPWSEEKKNTALGRIAKAKADAEAKAAAEKKAREEAEAAEKARFDQKQVDITTNIHPDAKDNMRAEDAWAKAERRGITKDGNTRYVFNYFNSQLESQLDKITDIEKAKRRLVAFYQEALKHSDEYNFDYWIKRFKEKMDRDIDL